MTGAFARIALRYVAGFLVARGLVSAYDGDFLASDPDVMMMAELGLGFAVGAAVELWYRFAKRMGWPT